MAVGQMRKTSHREQMSVLVSRHHGDGRCLSIVVRSQVAADFSYRAVVSRPADGHQNAAVSIGEDACFFRCCSSYAVWWAAIIRLSSSRSIKCSAALCGMQELLR
mmetsp:Transcript_57906/g.188279  ORF Transcript_57906/g.188279 Transcript_57906/m.188279 type:complete len:105 (-) Transcript_57906:78-392(-)